jgi:acetyl esterase/lipase
MTQEEHISRKKVLYDLPGTAAVTVQMDIPYGASGDDALTMDLYRPPDAQSGTPLPAVIIVAGYPDPGFQRMLGCNFKEMGSTTSWARLIAASGTIAVTYTNCEPIADAHTLLRFLRDNATTLGINTTRLALCASSGNAPLALSLLRNDITCAALCYPLTLDLDGHTEVADAAATFKFANPLGASSIHDLP